VSNFNICFRTGAEKGQAIETLLQSLNQELGTTYAAYFPEGTNTIVWVENYTVAKAANDLWESNQRLVNQFDPNRMSVFIPRWETILGLVPGPNDSLTDRKKKIADKFSLWSSPPTFQGVSDHIKNIIGNIFVELEPGDVTQGSVPGGAIVPGVTTFPEVDLDGSALWFGLGNRLYVRVWQPRDHNDNILMPTSVFQETVKQAHSFLDDYLPTYVDFKVIRYVSKPAGTVTVAAGGTTLVGSGTSFTTLVATSWESVDDNGNLVTYKIASVTDNTHAVLSTAAPSSNTNGTLRIPGFILDDNNNLSNETFL
jgi:hypothetical protein